MGTPIAEWHMAWLGSGCQEGWRAGEDRLDWGGCGQAHCCGRYWLGP